MLSSAASVRAASVLLRAASPGYGPVLQWSVYQLPPDGEARLLAFLPQSAIAPLHRATLSRPARARRRWHDAATGAEGIRCTLPALPAALNSARSATPPASPRAMRDRTGKRA